MHSDPAGASGLPLLGPALAADPFSMFATLRERGPVQRVDYYGLPCWLVIGHEAAGQLLGDRRLSVNPVNGSPAARAVPWVAPDIFGRASGLLNADPPDHTRLRRLVNKAFTPRQVESLRPRVREVTDQLIDAFAGRGEADLIGEFAAPLPAIVIMELIGLPIEERHEFGASCDLFLTADPARLPLLPQAIVAIKRTIDRLIEAKRRAPASDLLSQLILVSESGDQLDDSELRSMTFLLLLAGLETTVNLIGNGMLALLDHPAQLAALRSDPALIGPGVEEMLRCVGPVTGVKVRYATEEIAISGVTITPPEPVIISPAAANRDPERYPLPDAFDSTRADTAHLGFGHGVHFCVGAPLGRLEAGVAFGRLLDRCRDLKLACDPADLSWRVSPVVRGPVRLPVKFTPA